MIHSTITTTFQVSSSLFSSPLLSFFHSTRFLSCCLSWISISLWTSQTLHSTTTTFNNRVLSSYSHVTNHNYIKSSTSIKSTQTSTYTFSLSLSLYISM